MLLKINEKAVYKLSEFQVILISTVSVKHKGHLPFSKSKASSSQQNYSKMPTKRRVSALQIIFLPAN